MNDRRLGRRIPDRITPEKVGLSETSLQKQAVFRGVFDGVIPQLGFRKTFFKMDPTQAL